MFCTQCGAKNIAKARYCYECGSSLSQQTKAPPTEKAHSIEPQQKASSTQASHPELVQQPNFIVKHWRGEYSLGYSVWTVGILLALIKLAALSVVIYVFPLIFGWTKISVALMVSFTAACVTDLSILTWQVVGIWRSASKHGQRGGKVIWAGLAKTWMVLVTLIGVFYLMVYFVLISFGFSHLGEPYTGDLMDTMVRIIRTGTSNQSSSMSSRTYPSKLTEWTRYGEKDHGINGTETLYFDIESVRATKKGFDIWSMSDYTKGQESSQMPGYFSKELLHEVDCNNKAWRGLHYVLYSENMGQGKSISGSYKRSNMPFSLIRRNSLPEQVWNFVCVQIKK